MAISFQGIPNNLRVPFVAAEIDASQANQGPALLAYRGLIIGQKTSEGSADANSLHRVTSADQVIPLAGRGSMLHRQAMAWFASNRSTEVWIGVLADNVTGLPATGTIRSTGTPATGGTIALYLGAERVTVGVAAGEATEAIAAAIAVEINARPDLPVHATSAGSIATIISRNNGEAGNGFDLRDSYRPGEVLPAGLSLTYMQPSGGVTNPELDGLLAALGDSWFHVWTHPYTDATSLAAIEAELASRFGPLRMIDGVAVTSARGTFSELATLGASRNSQHSVIVAHPGLRPLTPCAEFAAEVAALLAFHGAADPARPLQTLPLTHSLPPAEPDLWTLEERNLLLFEGIATTRENGGKARLERIITTYQENDTGTEDTAYLDVTTLLTLMYLRYSFRSRIQSRYPRHKLGDDGVRYGPGQAIMTPLLGKAEALTWFRQMQELVLVEGFEQFKRDLVVERSAVDPNRLAVLLPPDLINSLLVTAVSVQFRL